MFRDEWVRGLRAQYVGSHLKPGDVVVKGWCEACSAPEHIGVIREVETRHGTHHETPGPRAAVVMLCHGQVREFPQSWLRGYKGAVKPGLKTLRKMVRYQRSGEGHKASKLYKKLMRIIAKEK